MSRESRLVKKYSSRPKGGQGMFGAGFTLPNHSGKHDAALYSLADGSVPFISGNKLTENNSNLYWDSTNERLWVGEAQDTDAGSFANVLHIKTGASFIRDGNAIGGPANNYLKCRGTFASPSIVASGDRLVILKGIGWDGTQWQDAVQIRMVVDTTPSAGVMPTRFEFHTENSSGSRSEKMRLDKDGTLTMKGTTGALTVHNMTTTQRDALTAVNGMIIYNTTTNAFNFYEAGAWVTK